MSEVLVKNNKFYLLTKKDGKNRELRLYADMETPIRRIREYLKQGMEPDNLELVSVEAKEEKFVIQSVPWSVIALKLVREGG
jgi:hypothetical protein